MTGDDAKCIKCGGDLDKDNNCPSCGQLQGSRPDPGPDPAMISQKSSAKVALKEQKPLLVNGQLAFLKDKATNQEYVLSSSVCKIGRDENNDVNLADDAYISRHHCWILLIKDSWWVEDLGSTNGTNINGDVLSERRQLINGDCIKVGKTELVFATK